MSEGLQKVYERHKVDVGIAPFTMAANALSRYYNMGSYKRMLIAAEVSLLGEGESIDLCVFEARNAAALGAQQFGVTQTFTQGTLATRVQATLATVAVGNTITINGLVYTAAAAPDYPNRVFDQSGNDTADAASLVLAINHATAGVPGVTARSALGVVTLESTVPGATLISTSETGGATIALVDLQQVGIFEVDGARMTDGYSHIAHGFYNGLVGNYAASVVVRVDERYCPTLQALAFRAEG